MASDAAPLLPCDRIDGNAEVEPVPTDKGQARRSILESTKEESSVEIDEKERALDTPKKRQLPKPLLRSQTLGEGAMHRRINHMHKLERKHSSGDLHSRLKTRKLLGVGETDDGDVHRSKLSQILGHSEQLYIKLPRGLRAWQLVLAVIHTTTALWALLFPIQLFSFLMPDVTNQQNSAIAIRCYGTVLLAFAMMSWCTFRSGDKDFIKSSLLASALYFTIQIIVLVFGRLQQDASDAESSSRGSSYLSSILMVFTFVFCIIATLVSYWYFIAHHPYHHFGSRPGSARYK